MKKLSIILLIFCLSFTSYAQDGQDGQGLDNRFYFRVGYSKPANSYLGLENSSWKEYITTTGGMFEIGSIFMLNNLDLGDGLRMGINVDYAEVVYHQFKYDDDIEIIKLHMGQVSSKAGLNLSFSPVNRLVFDGFFKLQIPWVAFGYFEYDDDSDFDEDDYQGAIGIGFSTGLNIRYGAIMLGFDYSSSSIKMNSQTVDTEYFGNFFDDSDTSEKSKIAYMNFTIGVNF